ncbi:uncharacterized protein LOC105689510 [Athalia rosae]|uniref:uncharacterized protein LOC105689510 n=1 Tax=Athalia rosae TaxID=37344 RepID=UPI002033D153|nr:uncharacterized protein LOC105689510 [Athalia rosae]
MNFNSAKNFHLSGVFSVLLVLYVASHLPACQSFCIVVRCRNGLESVNGECLPACPPGKRRFGSRCRTIRRRRSPNDEGCYGSDKIFVSDSIIYSSGPSSIDCPNGYYLTRELQCAVEGWEPNSEPWTTQHYSVNGRNLVLEVKQSSQSIRVRSVRVE